jgi:hypothetical protein
MLSNFLLLLESAQIVQIGTFRINIWWWPFVFAFFKNMFILLDVIIFAAIIMLIGRFKVFSLRVYEGVEEAMASGRLSQGKVQRKWEDIKELSQSEKADDNMKAVVLAGAELDNVLRAANFPGENLQKRLLKIPAGQLNFYDDIIWAADFRKKIESDPDFSPDGEEIKRSFYIFERALKDLSVL